MTRTVEFTNLLTKKQVLNTYAFAGMAPALIPGKGKKTVLSPPGRVTFEITRTDRKGTYGDTLFLCEHCHTATD